jgi:hypothetical protein
MIIRTDIIMGRKLAVEIIRLHQLTQVLLSDIIDAG